MMFCVNDQNVINISFMSRVYTMIMILGLHSMIFIGYGYTENPEFIENVSTYLLQFSSAKLLNSSE